MNLIINDFYYDHFFPKMASKTRKTLTAPVPRVTFDGKLLYQPKITEHISGLRSDRVKNSTRASISANSVEAQVVLRSNEDFWREFEIDFRNSNKMD